MFDMTDSIEQFPSAKLGDPWQTFIPCFFALEIALCIIKLVILAELFSSGMLKEYLRINL